ncbi:OmpA family protein [Paracoccus xiamenensis]|uniref:OmpA family protein n=1 Tax=Paracoccus xiamenensis TaxID=2714901 RepID=UPI001407E8D5|nr:OmpA family protein [Paracoccus xiamenensis]NHF72169.1 OmpA family protein [Paracoccus xiamenensis]
MNDPQIQDPSSRPGRSARQVVLTLFLLAAAGIGSWQAAIRIAAQIETRSAAQIWAALASEGQSWASVSTDGLVVRLRGTAPDEVARFRALTTVSGLVDDRRILDEVKIAERDMLEPPKFSLELMRQGDSLSLIGLLPARTDREGIATRLSASGVEVADLTSTAAFPAPQNWQPALDFAMRAADMLDQGTISVTPGAVRIQANAHDPEDKTRLEAALRNAAPEGISLSATVTAPLPVIAPYQLRFVRGAEGGVLEICAADSSDARDSILTAATQAGAPDSECALGIGAPTGWAQVAGAALAAMQDLGTGTLVITDRSIQITAPADLPPPELTRQMDQLAAQLPTGWTLNASLAEAAPEDGPASFTAAIDTGGQASIAGVVPDDTMRQTVQSLARAQLGPTEGELKLDPALREGWALRVMAGLDAMGVVDEGRLEVTQDLIRLNGVSGDPLAPEKAIAALSMRLGAGADYALTLAYDRYRDPNIAQPDAANCVDRLNGAMLQSEIGFEPGGARIAGDIAPVLDKMRPILAECGDYRMELAGHTDAQGSDVSNLALSRDRANTVLEAMRTAGLSVQNMVAAGYGETRPIAENDTQEGRDANRRIEVTLLSPDPVRVPVASVPELVGKTPSAEAAAETLRRAMPEVETGEALPEDLDIPAPAFDPGLLAAPPKMEPPATVQEAGADTPRPPGRPEDTTPTDTPTPSEEAQ